MARYWRISTLVTLTLALSSTAAAAPPLTTIQDTMYKADGTRFDGVAEISWVSFQAADGSQIPAQTITVRVIAGYLRTTLVPTTNALNPVVYTVKFTSAGHNQIVESWAVPPAERILRLTDVRTTNIPSSGPISAPLSSLAIADVTGLRSELDLRVAMGAGYARGRTALINGTGTLEAVTGSTGDCVRVDGTSGPCGFGGIIFVDGETPGGAIDGVNRTFQLSTAPNPTSSVMLFRNGLLLQVATDYTLAGNVVTMTPGRAPAMGDRMQSWYRVLNGTPTVQYVDAEVPAGTLNGVNKVFSLQNSPIPASSLQVYRNGVLQKPGEDYDLSVNTIVFRSVSIPQPTDLLQAYYRR